MISHSDTYSRTKGLLIFGEGVTLMTILPDVHHTVVIYPIQFLILQHILKAGY